MKLSVDQIFLQANTAHHEGKLEEAVEIFKKVIDLKPDYTEAHKDLGLILYKLKRFAEAVLYYKKAIDLKPDDPNMYNQMGNSLFNLGEFELAEIMYNKALELNPDIATAYINLFKINQKFNKLNDAIIYYRKSIELNPDFKDTTNFISKGDWENSKECLQKICLKDILMIKIIINVFIETWCVYCHKLLNRGDIKKFIKIYIKLLVLDEKNKNLNNLNKFLFDNIDFNTVIGLTELNDKILINLSYCKYKFMNRKFSEAEKLSVLNIFDATLLIKNPNTEDIGWLVVRRSLALFKSKKAARKTLNDFIIKSKLIN